VAAADTQISVTVSIGVAELGQHGHDLFELLAAADLALYRAKDDGRKQVRLYVPRQPQPLDPAGTVSEADNEGDEVTGAYP
jgi:predicted signal transduction protein with EAL and GGDEF domain